MNNLNSLSNCSILNANSLNVSGTSIFNNQITMLSSLNVSGVATFNNNVYALNIPKKSAFTISLNSSFTIGSKLYHRYDLDLTQYTKYITVGLLGPGIGNATTRKFKFMCNLATGAHNSEMFSLNHDISYSYLIFTGMGILPSFNGLNALAYGYPYNNYNLN